MTETLPLSQTTFEVETIYMQESAPEFACERAGECDNEAVYRVAWLPENEDAQGQPIDPCSCGAHSYLMCVPCYALLSSRAGLCWCIACSPEGPKQFKAIVACRPVRHP